VAPHAIVATLIKPNATYHLAVDLIMFGQFPRSFMGRIPSGQERPRNSPDLRDPARAASPDATCAIAARRLKRVNGKIR
jgi:hypothetical protein